MACDNSSTDDLCRCGPGEVCGHCFEGAFAAGRVVILPEEPPLTPEEEEQAPEDEPRCTCGETACESELCDCDSEPCPVDHAREAPEGPEYEKCVCGHIVPEHEPHGGLCFDCECPAYRTEPDFELPPQPDRRPPYAVAYSVQGHLYEVAVSGDARVRAVDGVLVISHPLGPVAGIAEVGPFGEVTDASQ